MPTNGIKEFFNKIDIHTDFGDSQKRFHQK